MQTNTQSTEGKDPQQTTGESSLDGAACSPLLRYKWRVGGTLDLYDSGDIYPAQGGEWVRWTDIQDMVEALKCAKAEKIGWKDAVDHALGPILSMENAGGMARELAALKPESLIKQNG